MIISRAAMGDVSGLFDHESKTFYPESELKNATSEADGPGFFHPPTATFIPAASFQSPSSPQIPDVPEIDAGETFLRSARGSAVAGAGGILRSLGNIGTALDKIDPLQGLGTVGQGDELRSELYGASDKLNEYAKEDIELATGQTGGKQIANWAGAFTGGFIPGAVDFGVKLAVPTLAGLSGAGEYWKGQEEKGLDSSGWDAAKEGLKETAYVMAMGKIFHGFNQIKLGRAMVGQGALGAAEAAVVGDPNDPNYGRHIAENAATYAALRLFPTMTKRGKEHAPGDLTYTEAFKGGLQENKAKYLNFFDPVLKDKISNIDPFVDEALRTNNMEAVPAVFDSAVKQELGRMKAVHEKAGGYVDLERHGSGPNDMMFVITPKIGGESGQRKIPISGIRAKVLGDMVESIKSRNLDPATKQYLTESVGELYRNTRDAYIYDKAKLSAMQNLKVKFASEANPVVLDANIIGFTHLAIRRMLKPLQDMARKEKIIIPDEVMKKYANFKASEVLFVNAVGEGTDPHNQAIRHGKMQAAREAYNEALAKEFGIDKKQARLVNSMMDDVMSLKLKEEIGGGIDHLASIVGALEAQAPFKSIYERRAKDLPEVLAGISTPVNNYKAKHYYRPTERVAELLIKLKTGQLLKEALVTRESDKLVGGTNQRSETVLARLKKKVINEIRMDYARKRRRYTRENRNVVEDYENRLGNVATNNYYAAENLFKELNNLSEAEIRTIIDTAQPDKQPTKLSESIIREKDGRDIETAAQKIAEASDKILYSDSVINGKDAIIEFINSEGDDFVFMELLTGKNSREYHEYKDQVQKLMRSMFTWGEKLYIYPLKTPEGRIPVDKKVLRATLNENHTNAQWETRPVTDILGFNPLTREVYLRNWGIKDRELEAQKKAEAKEAAKKEAAEKKAKKKSDAADINERPGIPAVEVHLTDGSSQVFYSKDSHALGYKQFLEMNKTGKIGVEDKSKQRIGWMIDGKFVEDKDVMKVKRAAESPAPTTFEPTEAKPTATPKNVTVDKLVENYRAARALADASTDAKQKKGRDLLAAKVMAALKRQLKKDFNLTDSPEDLQKLVSLVNKALDSKETKPQVAPPPVIPPATKPAMSKGGEQPPVAPKEAPKEAVEKQSEGVITKAKTPAEARLLIEDGIKQLIENGVAGDRLTAIEKLEYQFMDELEAAGITPEIWQAFRQGKLSDGSGKPLRRGGLESKWKQESFDMTLPHTSYNKSSVDIKMFKNPSYSEIIGLYNRHRGVRFIVDEDGNIYAWDADKAWHYDIAKSLGIEENSYAQFSIERQQRGMEHIDGYYQDNPRYVDASSTLPKSHELYKKIRQILMARENYTQDNSSYGKYFVEPTSPRFEVSKSKPLHGSLEGDRLKHNIWSLRTDEWSNSDMAFGWKYRLQLEQVSQVAEGSLAAFIRSIDKKAEEDFNNDWKEYSEKGEAGSFSRNISTIMSSGGDVNVYRQIARAPYFQNPVELKRRWKMFFNEDGSHRAPVDVLQDIHKEVMESYKQAMSKLPPRSKMNEAARAAYDEMIKEFDDYKKVIAGAIELGKLPWATKEIVVDPTIANENIEGIYYNNDILQRPVTRNPQTGDFEGGTIQVAGQLPIGDFIGIHPFIRSPRLLAHIISHEISHSTIDKFYTIAYRENPLLKDAVDSVWDIVKNDEIAKGYYGGDSHSYPFEMFSEALSNTDFREVLRGITLSDDVRNKIHAALGTSGKGFIRTAWDATVLFIKKAFGWENTGNRDALEAIISLSGEFLKHGEKAHKKFLEQGLDEFARENAASQETMKNVYMDESALPNPEPSDFFAYRTDPQISKASDGINKAMRSSRSSGDDFADFLSAKDATLSQFEKKDAGYLDLILTASHVADRHPDIAPYLNKVIDSQLEYIHKTTKREEQLTKIFNDAEKVYIQERNKIKGSLSQTVEDAFRGARNFFVGRTDSNLLGNTAAWIRGTMAYPPAMEPYVQQMRALNKEFHSMIVQEKKRQYFNTASGQAKDLFIELKMAGWDYDMMQNIPESYGSERVRTQTKHLAEKFKEIDGWGQDPERYFPEAFGGKFKIVNSRTGRIVASGLDPKQARDRMRENIETGKFEHTPGDDYVMTHSLYELADTRKAIMEGMSKEERAAYWEGLSDRVAFDQFATKLPRKAYLRLVTRLKNSVDQQIRDYMEYKADDIGGKTAEEMMLDLKGIGKTDIRTIVKPAPNPKFWQHALKKATDLKGDQADPFVVYANYMQGLEKKMAVDRIIRPINDAIESLPYSAVNKKRILEQQLKSFAGDYTVDNALVDGLVRNMAESRVLDTITGGMSTKLLNSPIVAKPFLLSRLLGKVSTAEAALKLGYAPVKSAINYYGGTMHTLVKEGARNWAKGRQFLMTPEGQKLIEEIGHRAGMEMLYTGSGREDTIASRSKIWMPLGVYNKAETGISGKLLEKLGIDNAKYQFGTRPEALAAAYVRAIGEGHSPAEAKEIAVASARLTQFMYAVADYPFMANKASLLRNAFQFKQYLMSEMRFLASLNAKQIAKYLGYMTIMSGTRGLWLMTKSVIPFAMLGAGIKALNQATIDKPIPIVQDMDKLMDDNLPDFITRGMPGLLGIDLTAPMTWQIPQTTKDLVGPGASDFVKTMELIAKDAGWTQEELQEWFKQLAPVAYNMGRGYSLMKEIAANQTGQLIPNKMGNKTMEYLEQDDAIKRSAANWLSVKTIQESKEQTNNQWMLKHREEFNRKREVLIDKLISAKTIDDKKRILDIMIKGGYYDKEAILRTMKQNAMTREMRTFQGQPKMLKFDYFQHRQEK